MSQTKTITAALVVAYMSTTNGFDIDKNIKCRDDLNVTYVPNSKPHQKGRQYGTTWGHHKAVEDCELASVWHYVGIIGFNYALNSEHELTEHIEDLLDGVGVKAGFASVAVHRILTNCAELNKKIVAGGADCDVWTQFHECLLTSLGCVDSSWRMAKVD